MTRLGDVAHFVRGVTYKPADVRDGPGLGAIPVLRTKNVQAVLNVTDLVYVADSVVRRPSQLLQSGDTLVSSANSWNLVGRCCWIPDLGFAAAIGGFVTALRPVDGRIHPRFLYHWFASPRTQALVRSFGNQTTSISNLNIKRCEDLELELPDMEEQRRIAAILDRADALVELRARSASVAGQLAGALFARTFGDLISPNGSWPMVKLGELARIIRGASPRPAGDPRYFGGPIPWLKISDVTAAPGRVVQEIKQGVTEAGRDRSVLLPPQTLILTNSATVGIAKVIEPATCIHDGFLAFLDIDERVDQTWLWAALRASRGRLVALAPEGTQKNLNGPIVKAVEISLPPIGMQRTFARELRTIETTIAAHVRAMDVLRSLRAGLQARVFSGQL